MHRGRSDGLRPCQDALGKDEGRVVAVEGPPEGKDYRKLERYFEDVLEGARLIEGQCLKDMMFE